MEKERISKNKIFTDLYIRETDYMMREGFLHTRDMQKYDFVFAGSDQISVREKSGAEIVRSLTGRECTVLLDPTMLVSQKVWDDLIEKKEFHEKERYILTYFLGDFEKR